MSQFKDGSRFWKIQEDAQYTIKGHLISEEILFVFKYTRKPSGFCLRISAMAFKKGRSKNKGTLYHKIAPKWCDINVLFMSYSTLDKALK